MRPILNASDEPVLDGIDVAIVHMAPIIRIVADHVLPKSTLPDPALVAGFVGCAASFVHRKRLREAGLINRHRVEKSASSGGSVKMAWM